MGACRKLKWGGLTGRSGIFTILFDRKLGVR
jgi:hypothetical protein